MAIPKNVFLGLIYNFPFTGITALRLCVLTSKNVRLYALTQTKRGLRRIRIRINSLERDLFAPGCVKNARKTLRVFLRFLPCRSRKSPLLRRCAVFSLRKRTDQRATAVSTDLFYSTVYSLLKTCISLCGCAVVPLFCCLDSKNEA